MALNGHGRLVDKVAIITGAGRGIGQATALKFATEGAKVVVCDLSPEWIEDTVEQISRTGRRGAWATPPTCASLPELRAMVDAVVARWGRVDCLVNNAGIVMDAQLKNMTDEQFDNVIDINLKGVYNCTRAVVDTMLKQQSGVILNASSIVGLYGNFGQTNYAASKFGVIGMVKTWAQGAGPQGHTRQRRVSGLRRDLHHQVHARSASSRLSKNECRSAASRRPEEIANTFAFLASDEASYINGAVIEVSGGLTI